MSEEQVVREIAGALRTVANTYIPEGVGRWLVGRKRSLGGMSPLEMLELGDTQRFLGAVERLGAGA